MTCIVKVNNVAEVANGFLCEDAGLAVPITRQRCGFTECPEWRVGPWSDCEISRCFTLHYGNLLHKFKKKEIH